MPYCMYLRKSRADIEAEARGEEETLARHERILTELAMKMNIYIPPEAIYREVVTAETIAARPVVQRLLSEVGEGLWEGVFVVEVERLARGETIDQGIVAQAFKYSGTKIITPIKTFDPNDEYDEEYFEFGLFMSRREYKTINRRLQRGRIASIKEGKYPANVAPYGYKRKKLEKEKGFTLIPDPEQAPIVKLIFEWYTKGVQLPNGKYERLGVSKIARKLNNELKIPAAKGGVWILATIRDILRNPVYIGKVRWNWRPQIKKLLNGEIKRERPRAPEDKWIIVEGRHEPLIDEETFNLAQYYLSLNPSAPAPKDLGIKNPLAGLVVCGVCGKKMVRRPYNKSTQPPTLICTNSACDNVSSPLYIVEEKLLRGLEKWLRDYKLSLEKGAQGEQKTVSDATETEIKLINKTIEQLDKEIATIEKQKNNLHDLLEQGIYTPEVFLKRMNLLEKKLRQTKEDKKNIAAKLEELTAKKKNIEVVLPKIEKIVELYWSIEDPAEKNELLRDVLVKVEYKKSIDNRWKKRGARQMDFFELSIYPRLAK